MDSTILILCLLLAVIIGAFILIFYIRRKLRRASRALFGTDSLVEGFQRQQLEYSTTPKSVSAMTSLLLPAIVRDFPDFEYNEMKHRAQGVLTSYLRAVTQKNPALLEDGTTELRNKLEDHIARLNETNQEETFAQLKLHRTEISQYQKKAGRCIITFQTALECFHHITENGQVVQGSRDSKYQTRCNVDLVYIQDRNLVEASLDDSLAVNCPNCGAPLSSLGAKRCEYCDSPIQEFNIHAWSFINVEEVR